MDNFSKERLQLLIEQIQLPETIVHEYFSETTLQKLTVFKETKTWQFQLLIQSPFRAKSLKFFR